jgi:hypothetical protein
MAEDFFSQYLSYAKESSPETPVFFHRWSMISALGAYLGRQYYFQHGAFVINPNLYTMLIGSPGTRKSTAIKMAKNLLVDAGYKTIAASKTSKEKFLLDLAGETDDEAHYTGTDYKRGSRATKVDVDKLLDSNLWGDDDVSSKPDAEAFIAADELNDFMGTGNIEFISLLGSLWDWQGAPFTSRIKTGKSISIKNPTISILAGNTPTGFALAFPTEILGQGFFSRIILVYGEPNGIRQAFPTPPDPARTKFLTEFVMHIRRTCIGGAQLTDESKILLERIYVGDARIDDVRFESYYNRRFNQLIKLCLIASAARLSNQVTSSDVLYANTILTYTEQLMPKALGEFGKSRNSDVSHKLIQLAESHSGPLTIKDFWKAVSSDLEKISDLQTLLTNLVLAEKLLVLPEGRGFLAKRKLVTDVDPTLVDYSLLTPEEREGLRV